MQECSFQPNIKKFASQAMINVEKFNQRAPMHERVGDIVKEKNNRQEQLRQKTEKEQEEELLFKPKINEKSEKIIQVKQMQRRTMSHSDMETEVVDRLYSDASHRIEKQMRTN